MIRTRIVEMAREAAAKMVDRTKSNRSLFARSRIWLGESLGGQDGPLKVHGPSATLDRKQTRLPRHGVCSLLVLSLLFSAFSV